MVGWATVSSVSRHGERGLPSWNWKLYHRWCLKSFKVWTKLTVPFELYVLTTQCFYGCNTAVGTLKFSIHLLLKGVKLLLLVTWNKSISLECLDNGYRNIAVLKMLEFKARQFPKAVYKPQKPPQNKSDLSQGNSERYKEKYIIRDFLIQFLTGWCNSLTRLLHFYCSLHRHPYLSKSKSYVMNV